MDLKSIDSNLDFDFDREGTAVVCGDRQITYRELAERSDQIAAALISSGVGPGDIVPIHLPREVAAVEALIGVIKSGAAFCFINTEYPADRVAYIIADTKAKLVIDEPWLANVADGPVAYSAPETNPDEPQLIVYTSGSTGTPKGVILSRRTVANGVRSDIQGRNKDDVSLLLAPFSFIASAVEILVPLSLGAELHIADDDTRRDPVAITKYIKDNGITAMFMPPQLARQLIGAIEDDLRIMLIGGDRVRDIYSDKVHLINVYGCSETCALVASFPIDKPYPDLTPIGTAPEGVKLYLLAEDGTPTPPGEIGEICVSGQIADGYLNLPELTAERFIADPFATGAADEKLFRTGDLGRLRDDGNLEYVQRKDWMIKVRGNRVEPGEIEAAITRLTPANQAVVTGFQNAAGDTALYACYTAPEPVAPEQVITAIQEFLPDYMLPSWLEQVDALPLNQNGKIDRTKIKAPDQARYATEYVAPQNDREQAICDAFASVLKLDRVGALDRFDLLGGDSILAARLQTRLAQYNYSIADILAQKTPRALAGLHREPAVIEPVGELSEYPLTFAERQMATERELDPDSVAYNVNIALEITGELDVGRLEGALRTLCARHGAFRSSYVLGENGFVHKVARDVPFELVQVACDVDDVPRLIAEGNQPFDLAVAPLYRFTLFEVDNEHYVLNLNLHHIIIDGVSANVVVDELWRLYNGEELEPLKLDYTDFAVWQNQHDDTSAGADFFNEMFADGVPENDMPTHASRPEILPFADTDFEEAIDISGVDALALSLGVSTYSVLFAAAALTLAKYCDSEDVTLGTAMSGRQLAESNDLVGMLVNTLAVRVKTPGNEGLYDFLRETHRILGGVIEHQTFPFEQLVPSLAPDRNASRNPIFDLTVNYLHDLPTLDMTTLEVSPFPIKRQALAADLMLELLRSEDRLRIVLSYSPSLYDPEVAKGFLEQFVSTLSAMYTTGANVPLKEVATLPAAQRAHILEDFAGPASDENLGKTVVDLFAEQATRTPEQLAVVFGDKTFTYAELAELTDRIASVLAKQHNGKPIGILVPRGELMPIAALSVQKSGVPYVPLDPSYPDERLEFMLADSGASLVIAADELRDRLPNFAGAKLSTAQLVETTERGPLPEVKPSDIMVLLYTSGTTGNPKGVMLSHANLVNFITWCKNAFGIQSSDAVAAYASFGFDACMMELYPTLTSGATLHVIPEEMRLDLPALQAYYEANAITLSFLTTQLGRQFAERFGSSSSLRSLSVGGETLVPLEPPADFDFYNLYGPTECTVMVTRFHVDDLYDRVPIGKPIDNTSIYVVDRNGDLAPIGVAGELCVAGRQVGQGYLGRAELTAEKFVPNPFSDDPDKAVIYRTGDVVRYLPDGNIEFVGRSDFQVKIRGFRVELTEIEGRIREYPGITDAAVVPLDAPGGGKCAVAYIVADDPIDVENLNRFIESELPPYMVPAATMQVDAIPLNPNGKVDRRKLPDPVFSSGEDVAGDRPLNTLELRLSEIIGSVLGHSDFSVTSNLLRGGLTSLSAIKLVTEIAEALGVSIPVRDLMQEPTLLGIENLAINQLLDSRAAAPNSSTALERTPLTASQLGLYYECIKDPSALVYNIPVCLSFDSTVDPERLRAALESVVNAHPALAIMLHAQGEELWQSADSTIVPDIEIIHCDDAEIARQKAEFVRPFELLDSKLWRSRILVTDDHVYLLLDFHHIAMDGVSLEIFIAELIAAYEGAHIEPETYSLLDAAQRELEAVGGSEYLAGKQFFSAMMESCDGPSEIPRDVDVPVGQTGLGVLSSQIEKASVAAGLASQGITAAVLFLGAIGLVVSRFTGDKRVGIATISSGREAPNLQRTMGMFVKTLPIVLDVEEKQKLQAYLRAASDVLYGAMAHDSYPFTEIATQYNYHPQIMYAYEGEVLSEHTLNGAPIGLDPLTLDTVKFPINITVEDRGEFFTLNIEYDRSKYSEATVQALVNCISCAAERLASGTDEVLGSVPIITPQQLDTILSFSADPQLPTARSFHELLEAQAARTPDRMALIATDCELTYRELNERANRIAHSLLARGVSKGDIVALKLRRTSHILSSMFGVLKAGCAYIPLDPDYPEERIDHIIADSSARFLIADEPGTRAYELGVADLLASDEISNPGIPTSPDDLCYIIYTSGSTGQPKGVMLAHRGPVNFALPAPQNRECAAAVALDARFVSVTTVSFDMFLSDVLIPFANGLTVVLATEAEARNPIQLAELFEKTGANALKTTPSVIMQYLESPQMQRVIANCKLLIIGAEKFPNSLYNRLREITEADIYNTYGPTEITVNCNCKHITDGDAIVPSVGPPKNAVKEQVMDPTGNPLPVGVTGELWIGGPGVALGYLGREDLTEQSFVDWDGDRYYRSGDLARWNTTGEIVIFGRNDGQVKLRGLRIELGEIETALAALDGVNQAVVRVGQIRGQDHLCAYYTASRTIAAGEVQEALAQKLPKYMVPTSLQQLDQMPVTANGKLNVKALPEPVLLTRGEFEAPVNATEEAFANIFQEALNLDEPVGATDSFFDLGGTSLLVTRVVVAATKNGYDVAYGDVFRFPTPRALAASLAAADPQSTANEAEETDSAQEYDYSAIAELLSRNSSAEFAVGEMRDLGNICLTGATGYLGIHLLREFLESEEGTAYCVVRGSGLAPDQRLKTLLAYYFEDDYSRFFGNRIQVLDGDVRDSGFFDSLDDYPIDTFINSAAIVKHFSEGSDISDTNVGGVQNAIEFCARHNIRLIHISTCSVAGIRVDQSPAKDTILTEQSLFFGQDLSNKYVYSKFVAERLVLAAAVAGLDAKVMRVGNLMARDIDGEFQINFNTNNFLGRLKAYHLIGAIPFDVLNSPVEFSAIDYTAKAILSLATAPQRAVVFHPYNNHQVYFRDIIDALAQIGVDIETCEMEEWNRRYQETLQNPDKAGSLLSLYAYKTRDGSHEHVEPIGSSNVLTMQALDRFGFRWPIVSAQYLSTFMDAVNTLGFFS